MAGSIYVNIDACTTRKGEYIGYAQGAWRIRREGSGWRAAHTTTRTTFVRYSLWEVSLELIRRNDQP